MTSWTLLWLAPLLGSRRAEADELFLQILEFLRQQVCPRLVEGLLAKPWPVRFGPVEYNPDGLSIDTIAGPRSAKWPAVVGVRLLADRQQVISVDRAGNSKCWVRCRCWKRTGYSCLM